MHRQLASLRLATASACMAAGNLPEGSITTTASGEVAIPRRDAQAIYAAFEGSAHLTQRLREELSSKGLALTDRPDGAAAEIVFKGNVVLAGGRHFWRKPASMGLGEAVEKSLVRTMAEGGVKPEVTRADVVQRTADMAVAVHAYTVPMTSLGRGPLLGGIAEIVSDATGLGDKINTGLTGDPRGICLSRCEDWNTVEQMARVWITYKSTSASARVLVLSRAFSETMALEEVVDAALVKALAVVNLATAAP